MRNRTALASGLVVLSFLASAGAGAGSAQTVAVDSIRDHLKQQWESIESIEWVLDEYLERVDGVAPPSPGRGHVRCRMARSKGGLSLYKSENAADGYEHVLEHVLEDGKQRYNYAHFHDYPDVIHQLDVSPQKTIDEGLDDVAQDSLAWLTTPGGKPLYMHMTSEARAREIEEDGRKLIEVVFPLKGSTLRCVLDPERDWSAVSLEFQDADRTRWEVTKFQRDNGRWFVSEGVHTGEVLGKYQEWRFVTTGLKINRPPPAGTYDPARLPSGALVVDRAKNTQRIWNGTVKTRNEFLGRHPSKRKPVAPAEPPPSDPGLARSGRRRLVLHARGARLHFLGAGGRVQAPTRASLNPPDPPGEWHALLRALSDEKRASASLTHQKTAFPLGVNRIGRRMKHRFASRRAGSAPALLLGIETLPTPTIGVESSTASLTTRFPEIRRIMPMRVKFGLALSFLLPMSCVPALLIGLAGATRAGDTVRNKMCVPGGTPCPQKSDEAYCPLPLSDNNYYCDKHPSPKHCDQPSDENCLDLTPATAATADPPYPCGVERSCKTDTVILSGLEPVYCSQVPNDCMPSS